MAWTTPRTWVTAEIPTAAIFNTHVRDDMLFLRGNPVGAVTASGVTIANDTITTITWSLEKEDNDAMVDLAGAPTKITIKTAGYFLVSAQGIFSNSSTGYRQLFIALNGGASEVDGVIQIAGGPSQPGIASCVARPRLLAVNDFLELKVRQTSGASETNRDFAMSALWIAN